MSKVECWKRLTRCDSGARLNPLMHIFLFITLVFSVAFVFFDSDQSVQASVLYQQTVSTQHGFLNIWGIIGMLTYALNYLGLLLRGRWGIQLMRLCWFGGFYLWVWATVVYAQDAYYLQLLVSAVPNLLFWAWYSWQWRRRYHNRNNACVSAFV